MTGISLAQVVEVLVDEGNAGYGSGYLLAPSLVLTARHVVQQANAVEVRRRGQRVPATVLWRGYGPEVDIALLRIDPLPDAVAPTFGDLSRVSVRTVPFDLVGFPRHKRRKADGAVVRDTDQVSGDIPAGANLQTGVLDLLRNGRPLTVGDNWAGLSGAAVFSRGLLVGVVIEAEEQGPLRALPLAPFLHWTEHPLRSYCEPEDSVSRLRAILQEAGVSTTALPVRRAPFYRRAEELVAAVPHIADRTVEYERLAAVQGPYSVWQSGPWAGKTTFAAHFAVTPPNGVDVVSFFFSRPRGQQAPQFWAAVCDQLAALLDESIPTQPELAFADLWSRACDYVTAQGRRLMLLVDGLDENTQPPPIAFDLPRVVVPGVHIAVFTRPVDDLLRDLYDHPLGDDRTPQFAFASNGLAGDLGRRAVAELRELLTAPDRAPRYILGLLAAAGPLGVADLVAILSFEGVAMDEGDVRRGLTLSNRVIAPLGDGDSYAVSHEALREEIAAQVDTHVHVDAAVGWATSYAEASWPDSTPDTLIDGYLRLLLLDETRLLDITRKPRAQFLRRRTGDDVAHSRELLAAFDAVAAHETPNLTTACELARAREELDLGYNDYPIEIARGWGLVGAYRRCEHLVAHETHVFFRVETYAATTEAAAQRRR
ncbi:hypothetical protein GCM10029964_090610 [Kibdelosporangium lantanae]